MIDIVNILTTFQRLESEQVLGKRLAELNHAQRKLICLVHDRLFSKESQLPLNNKQVQELNTQITQLNDFIGDSSKKMSKLDRICSYARRFFQWLWSKFNTWVPEQSFQLKVAALKGYQATSVADLAEKRKGAALQKLNHEEVLKAKALKEKMIAAEEAKYSFYKAQEPFSLDAALKETKESEESPRGFNQGEICSCLTLLAAQHPHFNYFFNFSSIPNMSINSICENSDFDISFQYAIKMKQTYFAVQISIGTWGVLLIDRTSRTFEYYCSSGKAKIEGEQRERREKLTNFCKKLTELDPGTPYTFVVVTPDPVQNNGISCGPWSFHFLKERLAKGQDFNYRVGATDESVMQQGLKALSLEKSLHDKTVALQDKLYAEIDEGERGIKLRIHENNQYYKNVYRTLFPTNWEELYNQDHSETNSRYWACHSIGNANRRIDLCRGSYLVPQPSPSQ